MLKKTTSLILFLQIFITAISPVSAFYSDVNETTPYYNEIKELYDEEKLPNYPDNKFNPDKNLTLPDLYEIVFTYTKTPITTTSKLPYSDIDPEHPLSKYINTAFDLNILKPVSTSPRIFPNSALNKSATLKNLYYLFGIGTSPLFDKQEFPFLDVEKDSYLAPLALKTFQLGILESTPELFRMSKIIKKSDLIHYIYTIENQTPVIKIQLQNPTPTPAVDTSDNAELEKFLDIWQTLKTSYYEKNKLNDNSLINGAIRGLLQEVDDQYTVYQNSEEAENFFVNLGETYSGIGIVIEVIDGKITVVTPLKNSPAEKAGIKPKDIIKKVNNTDVSGKTIEEITSKIMGIAGTTVKIEVERSNTPMTFEIQRANIKIQTVFTTIHTYKNQKIAQIELTSFGETTPNELKESLAELKNQNISGYIIDLRNNPGGYVDSAINIANFFTTAKITIFNMIDSNNKTTKYTTNGTGGIENKEIIVLMNEGSASAAEILAGFLKDHKIAKIIGTKSFGKGSVQELQEFYDNSFFKYTVANWTTPNGTIINGIGIKPDIITENPDEQLNRALIEITN